MNVDFEAIVQDMKNVRDELYRKADQYNPNAEDKDQIIAYNAYIDAGNQIDDVFSSLPLER